MRKNAIEKIFEKATWTIRKFKKEDYELNKPYEVTAIDGNLLLNEGINHIFTRLCESSGTLFDNTNSFLGVGDDNAAEDPSQTGLQAAVNKLYKLMDATYPTYGTGEEIVFRSTFMPADANFHWYEFTAANGNSNAAVNLNRKVSDQGVKTLLDIWELTLTISLS